MARKLPKTEFAAAVAQIAGERKIDPEMVIESVRSALVAAFKKDARDRGEEIDEEAEYTVNLDSDSGEAKIYLIEGKKEKDVTPPGFGRIATQTAKQVIIQKIREAEKEAIFEQYQSRVGGLLTGSILRVDPQKVVVGIGKAEAIMPKREQIRGEEYYPTQKLAFYLKEIAEEEGYKEIILSRRDPNLVIELFRREVPEVSMGGVEIKKIARQAGQRTKVAVASSQPGIDPVGSCVGQKGVRVQKVIESLGEEKVDIILHSDDPVQFIIASLSPAEDVKVIEISKENKRATVTVPENQLALAIGSGGENVHSASELTGYEIKVIGQEPEKEEETKEKKSAKKETDKDKSK
jgi:transcription termination/antitermination protein NusA